MRGNSLKSVEASHFPTSQYCRLFLADNPLVCNCSILWLWHLTQTEPGQQSAYTADSGTGHKKSAVPFRKNVELADKANVSCDIGPTDPSQTRHVKLGELSYGEIKCPVYVSYMVAVAIVGLLVVALVTASVIRMRLRARRRQRERKHIGQMVPQHHQHPDAKCRFEYRDHQTAIIGGHQPVVDDVDEDDDDDDELDHYEQFDDYRFDYQGQAKQQPSLFQLGLQPPSIVYV